MSLQKNVVDRDTAYDVAVLSAGVGIVLVRKAVKMLKQSFIILRQYCLAEKGGMRSFVVVENAHSMTFNFELRGSPEATGLSDTLATSWQWYGH